MRACGHKSPGKNWAKVACAGISRCSKAPQQVGCPPPPSFKYRKQEKTQEEIDRGPKKKSFHFYWINAAEREIPFPLWAQRPIRRGDVTRVLVLPSLRRVKSPEGQVGFITAKVLSDICHRGRPGQIIGMGFSLSLSLSLFLSLSPPAFSSLIFLVAHTRTHTSSARLSWCTKCVPKLVCKAFAFTSLNILSSSKTPADGILRRHTPSAAHAQITAATAHCRSQWPTHRLRVCVCQLR